ncbi:hypothetical protein [cyanobacterium endosymbiont of Rhopalodia gibberula]|uniref:hypothetical protein n=1 Tax=cyanobacterium endosymbiont of Rhopalodia gibberula TaxID=1763363 RepID=UPI000E647661|nr:hypothetical protein [cyanobacterium endosymbiont of Rhopalodia gibberula]
MNISHTFPLHPWWLFLSQAITKRFTKKGRLSLEDWSAMTDKLFFLQIIVSHLTQGNSYWGRYP